MFCPRAGSWHLFIDLYLSSVSTFDWVLHGIRPGHPWCLPVRVFPTTPLLLAMSGMKERKSAGVDEIPSKKLKSRGETPTQKLGDNCRDMNEEEKWPDDFSRTAMIPLKKIVK